MAHEVKVIEWSANSAMTIPNSTGKKEKKTATVTGKEEIDETDQQ